MTNRRAESETLAPSTGRRDGALWLIATLLVLLAACTGSTPSAARPSTTPEPTSSPTPSPRHGTSPILLTQEQFVVPPEDQPYPYTKPTPPPEPTRLDGTYMRILTLEDVHGLLPFRCLRCPPYYPNAGVSTLVLYQGDYWLNHQLSGFKALGMFTIQGHRITFFNDPWCPQDHGVYRWRVQDGALTFEAVSGTCAYEKARANDLSKAPWTHIQPCVYRIEHLWPGPVAC